MGAILKDVWHSWTHPIVFWRKLFSRQRATLSPAELTPFLQAGDYAAADRLALQHFSRYPALMERYEREKSDYVRRDLEQLSGRLGKAPNDEQVFALTAVAPNLLVKARAGSGKTMVIALKVWQLVERYGIKPEEILVLAFNRKAAHEVCDRVNAYAGREIGFFKGNVRTFHSLAKAISQTDERLLFDKEESETDPFKPGNEQARFVRDVVQAVLARPAFQVPQYNSLRADPRIAETVFNFVCRSRRLSLTPAALLEAAAECEYDPRIAHFGRLAAAVWMEYASRKTQEHRIDFDDLLERAAVKVEREPDCVFSIRKDFQQQVKNIKYILIDEFQDFSAPFNLLIQAIRRANTSVQLFCVGDDWQAINAFAGSDTSFFNNFSACFPAGRIITLRTNFRSAAAIVEHANTIMGNDGTGGIPMIGAPAGEVHLLAYGDALSFEDLLAQILQFHHGTGESIAVLSRRHEPALGLSDVDASTVHSYKGREADIVIVRDAQVGRFPLNHPANDYLRLLRMPRESILDEEQKLFYVAATRARKTLYLLYEQYPTEFIDPKLWEYQTALEE